LKCFAGNTQAVRSLAYQAAVDELPQRLGDLCRVEAGCFDDFVDVPSTEFDCGDHSATMGIGKQPDQSGCVEFGHGQYPRSG
jgi:hypothetical protein